jgi:hypothetical protein
MPDDPPVSTTVPETVTVETGADKESLGDLNSQFQDFWKEKDAEQDSAPSAPGDGAAQETKETKPERKEAPPETRPTEKEETPPPSTTPKELSDEEFEKVAMPPQTKNLETIENFKHIKDMWRADRSRAKSEADRAAKLAADLDQARANSWTPEAKADYEHAASIRRKFDFVSDPDFIQKFHAPVRGQFESILSEAAQVLPDPAAGQAWAKYIAENYQPDQLDRNWWLNSVIAKVPNEMDRSALMSSVTQLLKMQRERDTEITRRTNDRSSFDNWINEKTETTTKRVQEEIMAEIGIQEKRIQEVLPRDVNAAKTTEERRAIEEHNERFTKLNTFFQDTMKDISKNGPRAWVRASVEATRAMLLETEYKDIEKELKSVKAERDQYKADLDKITGVRRKISSTTGTPPSPSGKKTTGADGLSVRDLDVRKAFDRFDWGDGT